MIASTEALVLRVSPFSRTSHVVTWLTPEQGLLATTVRGAQRPRSAFLGQYDLFYTCELTHYIRERNGLHIAKECHPLNIRPRFRTDWRAAAAASYICDVSLRVSTSGGHEKGLYDLTSAMLDQFSQHGPKQVLIYWFELALMQLLGLAPQLQSCVACQRPVDLNARPFFLPLRGGILCHRCKSQATATARPLPPDVLALLRTWQATDNPRIVRNTRCTTDQLFAVDALLGVFLLTHIDASRRSRQIAVEMMSAPTRKP